MIATEWIAQLQPGSEVAIRTGHGHATYRIEKVDRLTATQVVLLSGARFKISNGWKIGASAYDTDVLVELTPGIREKAIRESAIAKLSGTRWDSLPTEALSAIAEMVEASLMEVK